MTSIKKGPILNPALQGPKTTDQATPATQAKPAETTTAPSAPVDTIDATGGTAAGALTGDQTLPRSGWGSQTALRGAVRGARTNLDAEVSRAGETNFRMPAGDEPPTLDPGIFLPMYGMPMPEHLRAQPKDQQLNALFNQLIADNRIDTSDAKDLVKATADGGVMSVTERQDLTRILNRLSLTITQDAVHVLDDALKSNPQGLELKSVAIRDALVGMMSGDFKINAGEAGRLVAAATDEANGAKLSDAQKADLRTIINELRSTDAAITIINDATLDDVGPIDIVPMYGVAVPRLSRKLKDKGLREAFENMLNDFSIDGKDVDKLIKEAKDGGGLSKTERADLELVLNDVSQFMTPEAKSKLKTFLGPTAPPFDPIDIFPMYGAPVVPPIDLDPTQPPIDVNDPIIRPMYGLMPVNPDPVRPIDTDPVIRPMYGMMPIGGVFTPGGQLTRTPRNVQGIRNMMPGSSGPSHYVILGDAASFAANVKTITINGKTTPVSNENGKLVARGVILSGQILTGTLKLDDLSTVPLNIGVVDAH